MSANYQEVPDVQRYDWKLITTEQKAEVLKLGQEIDF